MKLLWVLPWWRGAAMALGLMAASCSPAGLVNLLVPDDGYSVTKNQSYGPAARQTLDIYRPTMTKEPAPVVVFFYGGNWQSGSKEDYLFVAQALASRGFVVVVPDYRLYPEVRYPSFLEDGAAAVSWSLANLAALGGDPNRVFLMGHSAGAYIAAMLAFDDRWLGARRAQVGAMVGLAGPYDFLPVVDPALKIIFATEPDLTRTQPITFVDGSEPPLLVISGEGDGTVRVGNSQRLAAKIRATGGIAEERYYPGVSHLALVGSLAAPLCFLAPTLEDITAFLTAPRASKTPNSPSIAIGGAAD